jgi:ATP-dependent Lon protease
MDLSPRLFVLPLIETVIFPESIIKVLVDHQLGEKISVRAKENQINLIGLAVKHDDEEQAVSDQEQFYAIGTLIELQSYQHTENGYLLTIKGLHRVVVSDLIEENDAWSANFEAFKVIDILDRESHSTLLDFIKKDIEELSSNFQGSKYFLKPLARMESISEVIGYVLPYIPLSQEEKQDLLEISSQRKQSMAFIDLMTRQKESIDLQIEIAKKSSEKINKNYREQLLRQQLKAIQEELAEDFDDPEESKKDYRQLIENSMMPEDIKKVAMQQLNKLESTGPQNPEAGMLRNYLDLLVELPWVSGEQQEIDLDAARKILNEQHYGLEDVKKRIIQHLAVMKLKKEKKGFILLLVGPPGTGKTSLGKSIAEALDRKYVRVSLGGIRDEAEIRGHRRTYIGALPGRIIQGIRKAGEKNPVFVLDEVEKLMASFNGNPASALLEVLDPEQNHTFADHYLEVPYDLSEVFFVATANSLNSIPAPLLDRMEVIQISSYTNNEKFEIGRRYLLPTVLEDHGLDDQQLQVSDDAMHTIIEKYTREAGVRGLKKQLSKIARGASEKIVSGETKLPYMIQIDMLHDLLGREKVRLDEILEDRIPGVVTGLAWTPVGGDILFIEAMSMPGRGELILTGQLGDVMKESAKISLSLVRSRLAHLISDFDFAKNDIHIHVPSGAIPKDGPSAGITLFSAVSSLLLRKTVDPKLAMTGEITLRGSVLPVGGIKEKVLAAHRAGIEKILLSRENEPDIEDIPEEVRKQLSFVLVDRIEDVLRETLDVELPGPESLIMVPNSMPIGDGMAQ